MASSRLKLIVEANLNQIGLVGSVARLICHEADMMVLAITEVELALVEAVTNVIKYGLSASPQAEVEIVFTISERSLQVDVCDQGVPIPPGMLELADGSVFDFEPEDMDSWPTSGMGLSLIKAAMDEVDYRSVDGKNILRLIKFRERINETAIDS